MQNIYKYILSHQTSGATTELVMPHHSKLLSVDVQNDNIVLWAIYKTIQSTSITKRRRFMVCFTGVETAPDVYEAYIGTVTRSNGLVYHCFELPADEQTKAANLDEHEPAFDYGNVDVPNFFKNQARGTFTIWLIVNRYTGHAVRDFDNGGSAQYACERYYNSDYKVVSATYKL